jgi:hypothetical protein
MYAVNLKNKSTSRVFGAEEAEVQQAAPWQYTQHTNVNQ